MRQNSGYGNGVNRLYIASLNCRGLNKNLKRRHIFNDLRKYDIIALQETYITDSVATQWESEWGGKLISTPGTNHSKGLVILINRKTNFEKVETLYNTDRVLGINIKIHKTTYMMINVYRPNAKRERQQFFHSTRPLTRQNQQTSSLLVTLIWLLVIHWK